QAVKQLNEFNKMMQAKEIEANRLEVSLQNSLQALQDEYKITYEKACQDYIKSSYISSTRENVAKLKQSIAKLGNVNLTAIEEFEQVYERYAFLSEQQSDLLEAKATLHQVIAEMDEEMVKLFEETFLAIQEQFNHVFNELFGGGYAELRMTNPEELLETGIDIIAEPPGKKLKHLSRSEEHTSELQSRFDLVCRLLLEKKKKAQKERRRAEQSETERDRRAKRKER